MTTALMEEPEKYVSRPLHVLVPLIQKDLDEIDRAGMPHQKAVGGKLVEAREHFERSKEFWAWAEKNFNKSRTTMKSYMAWEISPASNSFKNQHNFNYAPKSEGGLGRKPQVREGRRAYVPDVDAISEKARQEQRRLVRDKALTQIQERDAERKLAHRLIDIGFKVLAKELHPDRIGGDRTAMARLNVVRDKLKHSI